MEVWLLHLTTAVFPGTEIKSLADVKAYSPYADLVSGNRILLLGRLGSGKVQFFNSVKSIFQRPFDSPSHSGI